MIQSGFHGTSIENKESIINGNFIESKGRHHWLGNGVYFFIEKGISENPCKDAEKWSIAEAWDKEKSQHKYKKYVIFKCNVETTDNTLLDLATTDGLKILNRARKEYINKIKSVGKKVKYNSIKDADIIEKMKKDFGIEFVINNFYFKFTEERVFCLDSKIPNVTVLAVSNPNKNINKKNTEIVKEGEIKNEVRRF